MKQLLHKMGAFSLALLLLFSTVSFSVDLHFCGDELVDLGFFEEDARCGMLLPDSPQDQCLMSFMNCCSDEEVVQEGQDELALASNDLTPGQVQFLTAFAYTYLARYTGITKESTPFDEYSPPLLFRDIHVVNETFLI